MSRLFLGNLRYDVVREDIESLFKPYGGPRDIRLKRNYGFIELSSEKNARRAIRELNGLKFLGDRLIVEWGREHQGSRGSAESEKHFRVMVENLDFDVSWQDLKDFMSRAGGVLRADVNGDGQGMADYATAIDAHLAVRTLSGETLRGKALIVRHMDPSRDLDWDKYRKFVRFREHNHYHPSRERNHLGRYLSSYHSRWYLDSYHDRRQERYRCRSRTRSRSPSRRVDARNGKTQRTWDRRRSRSHILESRYRNENDRVLRLDRQRSDSRSPERGPRGHRGRGVNR